MICPDERRDERACPGLSDAFAERHPRPNHGASSHSLRRASPLRSGSAVRSTAVSSPRHNESHSGDSQLSLLAPATMNLVREIRSAGRRRRRRPGAADGNEPGIPFSTTITVGSRENATVAKHAVLIMHRTDIRTHRDGWVVVGRCGAAQGHRTHYSALDTSHVDFTRRLSPHTGIRLDAGGSEAVTIAYRRLRYVVTKNVTERVEPRLSPPFRFRLGGPLSAVESLHDETAAA